MEGLWTPEGIVPVGTEKFNFTHEQWPFKEMKLLEWLAGMSGERNLGLHCGLCKQDFVGRNSDTDSRFFMACGCREISGENPLRTRGTA